VLARLDNKTKVAPWIPQNSLLAHPNVKAFLTHGGVNSVYQAVYHGVPILGCPFFADQPDNIAQAVYHGFGLHLDAKRLDANDIVSKLLRLVGDASFKAAVTRVQTRLLAGKRIPAERAADWVEHVVTTGGDNYLATPEGQLAWYKLYMLDVAGLLVGMVLVVVTLAAWLVRLVLTVGGATVC